MRSESTSALGHPSDTKPIFEAAGMGGILRLVVIHYPFINGAIPGVGRDPDSLMNQVWPPTFVGVADLSCVECLSKTLGYDDF